MIQHLGEMSRQAAERFGDKTALIFEGRRFSFAEIDELATRAAAGLAEIGVGPGDIVTLYAPNSWEWLVTYYAAPKLGAVINPINVMLTPDEVEFVVKDCGAKVIVASPEKAAPMVGVEARSDVSAIVAFGDSVEGATPFSTLLETNTAAPETPDIDPESLSTICYTSGTTGRPKGAMQSHRAVVLNTAMTAQYHGRTSDDVVVSALPCPHVYGNVVFNGCFMMGMTLVMHAAFDPAKALTAIEEHRATMFEGVPTMFMFMLNDPAIKSTDLSSLRLCTVGGQTMPTATMEAVEAGFGAPLIELWGMTEIAGLGSTHPLYGQNKHGSIGVAMPYSELRIADAETGAAALARGEVGELQVRGAIVMIGYYGDETRTKEALREDGWLRTGDLAKMDEDGCVFVVDRLKDMILTAGYNVYPAEIERVLAAHPDVALAAVGKQADELKGEIAVAYVVLKEGAAGDAEAMIDFCRESLAAYKLPRRIQFVADVPKTSTGKILRRELHTLDDS
ncbi:MAG: long-chain-fatty-acid--CoA ligase [Pseudomonadota bacterium]